MGWANPFEGFEEYAVGATPYPAILGGEQAPVTDVKAHTGIHSLASASDAVGPIISNALLTTTATWPVNVNGWVWLTLVADIPDPAAQHTPDLILIAENYGISLSYDDTDGPLSGYLTVGDALGIATTSAEPITEAGWYNFAIDWTGASTVTITATNSDGDVLLATTFAPTLAPGLPALYGLTLAPGNIAGVIDTPLFSWWDDISGDTVRDVTRLWPRDDARGLGAGDRIVPAPRSRRVVGGHL